MTRPPATPDPDPHAVAAAARALGAGQLVILPTETVYGLAADAANPDAVAAIFEAKGIQAYQDTIKQSLTADLLRWQGIQTTRDIAVSPNAKSVVIGAGKDGLPLILGNDR